MPENPRAIGLTVEMWNLFESCWRQNPKQRPMAEEVVRRWGKFVGDDDVLNVLPECVQTAGNLNLIFNPIFNLLGLI